ncbi:hypothetical protein [Sphingomonas daechungensis]|uniref:hypothetical protein n=1 Tax=Sphingomonas daechungensis TaxID=1176646 RepID=UPI003782F246
MTNDEETCSLMVIDFCRRHLRDLAMTEFSKIGARPEDIAIAASYAAFDIATAHKDNDPVAGVEFVRTSVDVIERSLLDGKPFQ